MGYSVGEVSRLAKVTVRTLHHYDEVGLLHPSARTSAGYRRYDDADLDRLQQILFYRELGFSLDDIAAVLDDSAGTPPSEHLRRQHALLTDRIARLQQMAAAVERALEARKLGINLTPEEKFEVFGEDYVDYEEEAQERWGETDAWKQSQRRASQYRKEDWMRIKAEADELNVRIGEAIAAGHAPDSPEGMAVAEAHRQHITRYFYDCSYTIHRGLAEMYLADPRFTEYYEKIVPGGAAWIRDAILANAARGEGS
ncbi:MerR family transcriptional regulator [Streptacidiphilus monticola]|uniref:MerR family transcriptional regulator n=1 Tax=Streptacidiphilus monticola TaxID=2161674 RepID=A0ABW1G9V0_9ACTN